MRFPQQTFLLFLLNLLDALLTIFWVRNGFASEGNHLMATLLDLGNTPFLLVKVAIGAVTAFVLWRWKDLPLAKYALALALMVYIGLMAVHFVTGLSALGLLSETMVNDFNNWAVTILT
ncbi:MAG TPA: DUF5658 family protein [Pyrinomonadaceae bacterium]|nr:DUF5658 family protein [Pyrinomonadaceae bacterium]